jgi:hypothetical protein
VENPKGSAEHGQNPGPTEREQNEVSHRRGIRATELRWYFYHIAQV